MNLHLNPIKFPEKRSKTGNVFYANPLRTYIITESIK